MTASSWRHHTRAGRTTPGLLRILDPHNTHGETPPRCPLYFRLGLRRVSTAASLGQLQQRHPAQQSELSNDVRRDHWISRRIPLVEQGKMIGAIDCSGGASSQDEVVCK